MKHSKLNFLLILASILTFSACQNNGSSKIKRDPESPMTYCDFNELDNNGNYYDKITGNALFMKGQVTSVDGFEGKAVHFDGESSLELSNFEGITGNDPFTLSLKTKANVDDFTITYDYTAIGIGDSKEFGNAKIGSHYGKYCMYYVSKYAYFDFPSDGANEWHTLTLSYDTSKFHFYLDGIEKQSVRVKEGMKLQKSSLYIGGYKGNGEGFIGDIDEVLVFDRCLEEKEIKSYMNMEKDIKVVSANNVTPTSDDENIFSQLVSQFVPGEWTETSVIANKVNLQFIIHIPEDYSDKKTYPLILFLHGSGSNSWTPRNVLSGGECTAIDRTLIEYPDTICLVPANIENWIDKKVSKVNGLTPEWSFENAVPSSRLIAVVHLINGLIEPLHIDRQRIHFQGVSMGCMAGWYLFAKYPNMFASAIMVEGTGPTEDDAIKNIAKTPVWMFMSEDDQLVSYVDFKKLYDKLVEQGADAKLTSVKGYDHFGTNTVVYAEKDLVNWLYSYRNTRA